MHVCIAAYTTCHSLLSAVCLCHHIYLHFKSITVSLTPQTPLHPGTLHSKPFTNLAALSCQWLIQGKPQLQYGTTDDKPMLPVEPEVFVLRKLMPATDDYDFNIHVMDFKPGEYLYIKEIHYNQHGLLLLQGQGIYRLGNNWYPVQAGDAIWMPPFVLQWYAALGSENTRYLLYKDTAMDPLLSP